MTQTIRFVVSLTIRDGKFDEFDSLARAMAAGTSAEPGAVAYEFYLSGDKKRCRLYEEYRDDAVALAHLSGPVVNEMVPQLLGMANLDAFEVYGDLGPATTSILQGFGAGIFAGWHGIQSP